MIFDSITRPTLLLDPARCKANIRRLRDKTTAQKVLLRPHFKTHQSRMVGQWFRALGTEKITVSSVGMAQYFVADGWNDITIAFPVNIRQVEEIRDLAEKIKLGLLVLNTDSIEFLGKQVKDEVNIWIKIDVGTHRTGISPEDTRTIDRMVESLKGYPQLYFNGFLAHAGHSYNGRSLTEIQRIYDQALDFLVELKRKYVSGFPELKISVGDTPGVSMVDQFGPVDELRPGNFVFYDLMQEQIGACTMEDIAVALACPVVAVHPERKQWIIYGGGIHFSKDYMVLADGNRCFGRMADIQDTGWSAKNTKDNPYLISLSQEHGVVQCNDRNFDLCKPGDLSLWLPVHSCLTADAMGEYVTVTGDLVDHYRKHLYK